MAVHAHPDDESSKGAASMAKYVAQGVDVLVATCTGGERGSILNPKLQGDAAVEADIHELRRSEMDAACEILGVKQAWLGFVDSGMPQGDPLPVGCFALVPLEKAAEPLVRLIRQFRPHVITTYDENGGYPHPDHIMTHKVTMAAFETAADPASYPESGQPWQPLKVYYNHGMSMARVRVLHAYLVEHGQESPFGEWIAVWDEGGLTEREITTRVQCADWFDVRDRALLAHATQIDPDGPWFRVPLDVQREVWPTEEYELARSLVDTRLPEDDLFAGITVDTLSGLGLAEDSVRQGAVATDGRCPCGDGATAPGGRSSR